MDKSPVQEDLYEFHHLAGSTPGTYWLDVRTVIAEDAEARLVTPSPKSFPPITAQENRTIFPSDRHTPGYHGDSPIPPQGLPPIMDSRKLPCSTTRPPDAGQTQLFFKKPDTENKPTRLMDKNKHTHPLHRGMIEAVEEPTVWKMQKKKRIENAIERVNNKYVVHPRNYREQDISERVDSQFMPTPPKDPRPRKHNLVILNPEQMLRDRDHMRGDFAPSRPPGHVPESCYRRAAPQMPTSTYEHAPTCTNNMLEGQNAGRVRDGYPVNVCVHHADAYDNTVSSAYRPSASAPNTQAVFEHGQAWRQNQTRRMHMAQERIQQEYVDELRMEDDVITSSQTEIDLDVKRQQMLARKCIEKRRREAAALKHAELLEACPPESEKGNQPHVPAPPLMTSTHEDSYSKRKRHLVHEHAQSTLKPDLNMAEKVTEGVEGFSSQPKTALIPRSTRPNHGPVIRVEPQLTWNATAAKRGLGFKSKLRREQEAAALKNKGHQDDTDGPRRTGTASPSLPEETRRRWKNKTICNQP